MKELILPFISFLFGAAVLALIYRQPVRTAARLLDDLGAIYEAMRKVVDSTPADRFLILRGSNGGGVPRPGADFHITLVHEAHKNPTRESVRPLYSDLVVDAAYIGMIQELIAKGEIAYTVPDMPTGLLKIIYLSESITYSRKYYLGRTQTEIYFASITTRSEHERFNAAGSQAIIELSIRRIREIFKKYS